MSEEIPGQDEAPRPGLREEAEWLGIVNRFALSLIEQDTIDDIAWSVAVNAVGSLGFEDCVVYLLDEGRTNLVQRAAFGPKSPDRRQILNPIVIPVGIGITGAAAASGNVQLVADTRTDERYVVDDAARHSELAVPIKAGRRVLGVIDSEHSSVGFFTQRDVEILETIAAMTASRLLQTMASEEAERLKSFYAQVLDKIPKRLQLAVFDNDLRYQYVSPSAVHDEQRRLQIIGKTDAEWARIGGLSEGDAVHRMEILERVRRRKKPESFREELRQRDGSTVRIARFVEPVLDDSGDVLHLLGYGLDITEETKTQEALEESEARYRTMVESATDLIWQSTADGHFTYANPTALRTLGQARHNVVGHHYLSFVADEAREETRQFYETQLAEGTEVTYYEFPIQRSDGTVIWLGQRVRLLTEGGEVTGISAVARDITVRRFAEEAVKAAEIRKSAMLASSLDAVVSIDEEGRIVDFNPAAEEIFGYSADEVLGRIMAEVIVPERYRDAHLDGMERYLKTGEGPVLGKRIEITALRRNGEDFPIELAIQPISVSGSQMFTATIRDITAQKQAEDELRRANDLAAESVRAKERFLANMSHEMRTPLNAVIGLTHLMLETATSASQKDYLDAIRFSADNLLVLVNDILDLAKIESGTVRLEEYPFRLADTLESIRETFLHRALEKGIEMKLDVDPTLPDWLSGDPVRVGQILMNLVGNAVKFTPSGKVVLRARSIPEGDEGQVAFEVQDTGIGIPPEQHEAIFADFAQAAEETTRRFGGTGLGLAIARQLVRLHGGTIEVQSEEGKGSLFTVTIHFRIPDEDGIKAHLHTMVPARDVDLSGLSVLLVEDNEMNQYVAKTMLQNWGTTVSVANNGREAVQLIESGGTFDVVLMDIQMPEMDGYEATRRIRVYEGTLAQSIPIIALTASTISDSRRDILEAGMNDFLLKPFKPDELKAAIAFHVGRALRPEEKVRDQGRGVDLEFLKRHTASDTDFIIRMLSIFEKQTPELLAELETALGDLDFQGVHRVAHKLKSSAALLGLNPAVNLLKSLEELAEHDPDPGKIRRLTEQAIRQCESDLETVQRTRIELENAG